MTPEHDARPARGAAITTGVLACFGAAHRLLSAVGAVVAYSYLDSGTDRVRAAFGPARTILATSIPIWVVIGTLLLAGGVQLFRRKPSARWLIITGCTIDIAYLAIEYLTVRMWADHYEHKVLLGGPGLLVVGVVFPFATIVAALANSTSVWISDSARTAPTRGAPTSPPAPATTHDPYPPPASPQAPATTHDLYPSPTSPQAQATTDDPYPPSIPWEPQPPATDIGAPSPRKRRPIGPAVAVAAAAFVGVAIVTAALIIARSDKTTHDADTATTSATTPASPQPAGPQGWGKSQWIADLFPKLLPTKQTPIVRGQIPPRSADGWLGLTCQENGSTASSLECAVRDTRNPYFTIVCTKDEQADSPEPPAHGDGLLEKLLRPSGTVDIWHSSPHDATIAGVTLSFGGSPRSRCAIYSSWQNHGVDELISWWSSAPL